MAKIDEMFRNSEAETASETEKSFFGNFFGILQGFVTILLIVTGLVALCIVFIAANTASMSVRERVGEIAVLKALGFRRRTLFGTLVFEAALLSTLAGALGVAMSLGLTRAVANDQLRKPRARPARRLHRHEGDPRAGSLPRALRRHPVRRRCRRSARPASRVAQTLREVF